MTEVHSMGAALVAGSSITVDVMSRSGYRNCVVAPSAFPNKTMLRDQLVKFGVVRASYAFWKLYFQLEVVGQENLPAPEDGPCLYVMNHTAMVGLDVSMMVGHLLTRNPEMPVSVLAWGGFTGGLGGRIYRGLGCQEAKIDAGIAELRSGTNVFILPEGVDATDVRPRFHPFHTGYLRMVKEERVPIVPIGFFGIDQVNPWFYTQQKKLVELYQQSLGDDFDVAIIPKLPFFRPVKVVYRVGEALHLNDADLATESALSATNQSIRDTVIRLSGEAESYRYQRIGESRINSALHDLFDGSTTRLFDRFRRRA
jgi:1-acyl-sn-glycerol-3-phosphate acyltransferase